MRAAFRSTDRNNELLARLLLLLPPPTPFRPHWWMAPPNRNRSVLFSSCRFNIFVSSLSSWYSVSACLICESMLLWQSTETHPKWIQLWKPKERTWKQKTKTKTETKTHKGEENRTTPEMGGPETGHKVQLTRRRWFVAVKVSNSWWRPALIRCLDGWGLNGVRSAAARSTLPSWSRSSPFAVVVVAAQSSWWHLVVHAAAEDCTRRNKNNDRIRKPVNVGDQQNSRIFWLHLSLAAPATAANQMETTIA